MKNRLDFIFLVVITAMCLFNAVVTMTAVT